MPLEIVVKVLGYQILKIDWLGHRPNQGTKYNSKHYWRTQLKYILKVVS